MDAVATIVGYYFIFVISIAITFKVFWKLIGGDK